MRKVISACAAFAVATGAVARAQSVADIDAAARAGGNRKDLAVDVGRKLFEQQWPAQVYHVSGDAVGAHVVVGLSVWGVKFHRSLTRAAFAAEIVSLVRIAFQAAPEAEEVDVWSEVPIDVGAGVIVSGDLAKPTTRTVFTATVRRGESPQALEARLLHPAPGVFWDEAWQASAFKRGQ